MHHGAKTPDPSSLSSSRPGGPETVLSQLSDPTAAPEVKAEMGQCGGGGSTHFICLIYWASHKFCLIKSSAAVKEKAKT